MPDSSASDNPLTAAPSSSRASRPVWTWLASCFLIGTFAGLLAWFFPRIMALTGADLSRGDSLTRVFPPNYLVVGAIVALLVGLTIAIIEQEQRRSTRDVFFAALGLPTLLMGAIGTQATEQNLAEVTRVLNATTEMVAARSGVATRTDISVPALPRTSGPDKGVTLPFSLFPEAHARAPGAGLRQNGIGLQVRQPTYFVIYAQAPTREALAEAEAKLRLGNIPYQLVPGSRGDFLLVPPGDGAMQPYTDAVLAGSRARAAGVDAYIAPAQR